MEKIEPRLLKNALPYRRIFIATYSENATLPHFNQRHNMLSLSLYLSPSLCLSESQILQIARQFAWLYSSHRIVQVHMCACVCVCVCVGYVCVCLRVHELRRITLLCLSRHARTSFPEIKKKSWRHFLGCCCQLKHFPRLFFHFPFPLVLQGIKSSSRCVVHVELLAKLTGAGGRAGCGKAHEASDAQYVRLPQVVVSVCFLFHFAF